MEARLGAASTTLEYDKLDQFLKYDRKVTPATSPHHARAGVSPASKYDPYGASQHAYCNSAQRRPLRRIRDSGFHLVARKVSVRPQKAAPCGVYCKPAEAEGS